jgi:hypothetical protein
MHKQRIKHLLFEQQAEAVDKQIDGTVVLKVAQESGADSERELKADVRDLKVSTAFCGEERRARKIPMSCPERA